MKIVYRWVILCFLAFLNKQSYSQNLLSVEETIELAKKVYFDAVPTEDIEKSKRANPAARPYLYDILNDSSQRKFWAPVMGSFCYLGQEDDISKLEAVIKRQKGTLYSHEYRTVSMFFNVLAEMGNRGIEKAKQLHHQMLNPKYWEKVKFTISNNALPGTKESENAITVVALKGYAYTKDVDFQLIADSVFQRISARINSEEQKRVLKEVINGIKQANSQIRAGN